MSCFVLHFETDDETVFFRLGDRITELRVFFGGVKNKRRVCGNVTGCETLPTGRCAHGSVATACTPEIRNSIIDWCRSESLDNLYVSELLPDSSANSYRCPICDAK